MKNILSREEMLKVMDAAKEVVDSFEDGVIDEVKINYAWDEKVRTTLLVFLWEKDPNGEDRGAQFTYNMKDHKFECDGSFTY